MWLTTLKAIAILFGRFAADGRTHPTYVAVCEVTDETVKLVEVVYAGTHEKAPY